MKIGDYVRFKHGIEEGYITQIIDERNVEIETKDGFTIPALKADLVVVDAGENDHFYREQESIQETSTYTERNYKEDPEGVFIGSVHDTQSGYSQLYLINNTDTIVLFSILRKTSTMKFSGLFHGEIRERSHHYLDRYIKPMSPVPKDIHVQLIFHSKKDSDISRPITQHIQLRKELAQIGEGTIPVIHSHGKFISISDSATYLDEMDLKSEPEQETDSSVPDRVVDLHADAFIENYKKLGSAEIVAMQIDRFNKQLEKAIIAGLDEITFIHGVGDGSLKRMIIDESKNYSSVHSHHPGEKRSFGSGATVFRLSK